MISVLIFLSAAVFIAFKFIPRPSYHTANVFHATGLTNARLTFTPTRLSALDISVLVILVIYKYTTKLVNLHIPCKVSKNGKDFALPRLTLSAPLYISNTDIENFAIAVNHDQNEDQRQDTEGNSPLLLPAVTTPLLLIMLSNRHCPVFPFGAMNTKNRFEFLDPMACRSVTSLKDASVTAYFGGEEAPGRRVKRGMEFDIVFEVEALMVEFGRAERKVVFRQIIGILVALPKSTKPVWREEATAPSKEFGRGVNEMKVVDELKLLSDAPKKWATVCKDVNPIHMSSLAAKLFGLPGKIAHGNHVAALVVEKQLKIEGSLFWHSEKPWFLEINFKRPMVLPLDFQIKMSGEKERRQGGFELVNGEKIYVTGNYGEL